MPVHRMCLCNVLLLVFLTLSPPLNLLPLPFTLGVDKKSMLKEPKGFHSNTFIHLYFIRCEFLKNQQPLMSIQYVTKMLKLIV